MLTQPQTTISIATVRAIARKGRNANLFEHPDEWLGCSISHTQVSATQLTAAECNGHRSAARWRVNELV
jgi:hypothetical protein